MKGRMPRWSREPPDVFITHPRAQRRHRCAGTWHGAWRNGAGAQASVSECGATVAPCAMPRREAPLSLQCRPERSGGPPRRDPRGLASEHVDTMGIRWEEYYCPPIGERQPYSEQRRAKRRGRRTAPATIMPRRKALLVCRDAHRGKRSAQRTRERRRQGSQRYREAI